MKKMIFSCLFMLAAYTTQAQAVETKTAYNKVDQPCIMSEYAYDADFVEKVITDDLKQRGFGKGKTSKGYNLYQAINFAELGTDKMDLYLKVEKKGKKEKDRTVVTLLLSKGYDNFMSSTTDANTLQNAINYLNNLKPKFDANNLDVQIKDQEELVRKEEKKYTSLQDDATDLEKKKRKIEDNITDNKAEQAKQKTEIDKQRQILDALKTKKKS